MTAIDISNSTLQELLQKLPAPLQRGVGAFASEFEKELFLYSALTVSSGLFNKATGRYFQREVLPNLFLLALAPPAAGKGAMLYAKKMVQKVHEHFLRQSMERMNAYAAAMKEFNIQKKKNVETLPPVRPAFKVVNIPGNCSASKMLQHLSDNQEDDTPSLIIESEIDTLTTNGMSEWPAIDEMLRKAFHNEPISYSRKTNHEYIEVDNPSLAVALSGTPNQLFRLITSAENGTYSRFLVLESNQEPSWMDVRPCQSCTSLTDLFQELGQDIFEISQFSHANPFEFHLHDDQWDRLNEYCACKLQDVLLDHGDSASSLVKRHGLMIYKIAMVLTCYRKYEWDDKSSSSYCLDDDLSIAIALVDRSLSCSLNVFKRLPAANVNPKGSYKEKIYEALPSSFDRKTAIEVGRQFGVSTRTVDRCLNEFITRDKLESPIIGTFNKK